MFHLLISNLCSVLESLIKGGEGVNKFGNCNIKIKARRQVHLVEKQDLIVMDVDAETHAYLHREGTKMTGTQVMVTLDEACNIGNEVIIISIVQVCQ